MNKTFRIRFDGSENMRALRTILSQRYGIEPGSFIITFVLNCEFTQIFTVEQKVLPQLQMESGCMLLYEINPEYHTSLPKLDEY